jgi:hypothetical protein
VYQVLYFVLGFEGHFVLYEIIHEILVEFGEEGIFVFKEVVVGLDFLLDLIKRVFVLVLKY